MDDKDYINRAMDDITRGSNRLDRGSRKSGGGSKARATPSHRRSVVQEREISKRLGGRLTAGSGNKDDKGDVVVKGICRVEAKTTKHKSFSVTLAMAAKIEEAAMPHGEVPCIMVEFITEDGVPVNEMAVMPTWALEHLISNQK